jgi:hypothetical protein
MQIRKERLLSVEHRMDHADFHGTVHADWPRSGLTL